MADPPIELEVHAVKQMRDDGEPFVLLDCRRPEEHRFAHISGDKLIPMDELPQRAVELSNATRIVVYCHLGARSLMVAEWMRSNGFPGTQSMAGGIDAWSQLIDSTIPRYQ